MEIPEAEKHECEQCHDLYPINLITWTGTQSLCPKCYLPDAKSEKAVRVPTCSEARQIMQRFNASHFGRNDHEQARYSVPADPNRDDDLLMEAFINQSEDAAGKLMVIRQRALIAFNILCRWEGQVDSQQFQRVKKLLDPKDINQK